LTVNQLVVGSIPTAGAKYPARCYRIAGKDLTYPNKINAINLPSGCVITRQGPITPMTNRSKIGHALEAAMPCHQTLSLVGGQPFQEETFCYHNTDMPGFDPSVDKTAMTFRAR
jgi:hypothetical protein